MKTIGLLGGMTWESTQTYYQLINQRVKALLGGYHCAQLVLYNVDFAPLEAKMREGKWREIADALTKSAQNIEAAGADFLLLCTNSMHKVAHEIEASINIPFLHIADTTAEAIKQEGIKKVGLLGTMFTMEEDFYSTRLLEKHGIETLSPGKQDRDIVHRVIFQELCFGQVTEQSRKEYLRVINTLKAEGAEGVILGCTEIGMLVSQDDTDVKLFDTTLLHIESAIAEAGVKTP